MATYIYISSTGKSWADDDEEAFRSEVYKAAAEFSAAPNIDDLDPLQFTPAAADEYEFQQSSAPAPPKSTFDYALVDPEFWPTPARAVMALWNSNDFRHPAYVELSHSEGETYPHTRVHYNSNWLATELRIGVNMKVTMKMKPSPLQQSMTWEEGSEGEYIKEAGLLLHSILPSSPPSPSSPALSYDSHSDEEQDKARIPPDSPPVTSVTQRKDEGGENSDFLHELAWPSTGIERYDAVAAAIDIPVHDEEDIESNVLRAFVNFRGISNTLNVDVILEDATRNMLHNYINGPSQVDDATSSGELKDKLPHADATCEEDEIFSIEIENTVTPETENVFSTSIDVGTHVGDEIIHTHNKAPEYVGLGNKAEATTELNTTNAEALHIVAPEVESPISRTVADYNQFSENKVIDTQVTDGSISLTKVTGPSPDLKYNHDPTNTSLIWNTISAGWFTLCNVPWGCIAVATAGALVDVATFVARR
jgi:hypothetical protein